MAEPVSIKTHGIYDVIHNDKKKIVIIMPSPRTNRSAKIIKINEEKKVNFELFKCGDGHAYVYISEEEEEYKKEIKLEINGKIIETKVNKYPCYKGKILMSTMVYNEDNYIRQWIKFNRNIGVDNFIIYDNSKSNYDGKSHHSKEETSNLSELLKDLIEEGTVLLINWPYLKRESRTKISGQACQQNHTINTFKTSKYIGLFDIDEYLNMQEHEKINELLEDTIETEKLDINEIGSFVVKCKFFFNPHNKPEEGYEFLKISDCGELKDSTRLRCKNFIIPKNVTNYCVHNITNGKSKYGLNKEKVYFNHYFYLNKEDRGRENKRKYDNSIMRHTTGLF